MVGVADQPVAVVALARRLLPTYFEFISVFEAPRDSSAQHAPMQVSDLLDELCASDDALYAHAAEVFAARAKQCGVITRPMRTRSETWMSWFWP
jgi:hypothetical protein